MGMLIRIFLFAILFSCASKPQVSSPAAKVAPTETSYPKDELTAHIKSYESSGHHPGAFSGFVLVTRNNKVEYSMGFCCANFESKSIPTANTAFRIGSVTKQITAVGILKLVEAGKLSLTDKLGDHLKSYPEVGRDVTIHQLLTHTSGIPSYTADPKVMENRNKDLSTVQLLATFSSKPLEFIPGTEFRYSNSGYAVLGAIIEKVSGNTIVDFTNNLFSSVELTNSSAAAPASENVAIGYSTEGNQVAEAAPISMTIPHAAGNVYSSAADMAKWTNAIWNRKIISKESLEKMLTADKQNYSYGWMQAEAEGYKVFFHGGGIDGFSSTLMFVPDLNASIVVLSNKENFDAGEISKAAYKGLVGKKIPLVTKMSVFAMNKDELMAHEGTYRITEESKKTLSTLGLAPEQIDPIGEIIITSTETSLFGKPKGQPKVELTPTSPTSFEFKQAGIVIDFAKDKKSFQLSQGGLKIQFEKVTP